MKASKKRISRHQLRGILEKVSGTTFAHVVAFTDEYGSRVVNKVRQLQKLTFRNITIGSNYENRVNRRLEKQGEEANFTSEAMSGKNWVEGSKVLAYAIKTPEKLYLVCDQEKTAQVRTIFYHQGKRITQREAIVKDLFSPSYFTEKKTAGRGQVSDENNFFRLTISLENIIAIKLNKVEYIVED